MKRLFDILMSIVILLFFSPVLLMLGLALLITSRGPIFYRQQRVGRGGSTFWMLKFRSMVVNADRIGSYITNQGDPRITPIGAFIRRTSLDELPQLINVLLGDMSLVGPRPDVPAQRSLYSDNDWAIRTSVRPGITGLAQATLRSGATHQQRLTLDLEYVQRKSFCFDLKVLVLTVRQVLGKGSH